MQYIVEHIFFSQEYFFFKGYFLYTISFWPIFLLDEAWGYNHTNVPIDIAYI